MPFIKDLLQYKSISFVGMDKNAGKTEALNYVLSRLHSFNNVKVSVTSIGIDGETIDQVTDTSKPRVFIYPENTFVTSEQLYPKKEIFASITDVSEAGTTLGRLITAQSKTYGNVMLSGPTDSTWLKNLIKQLLQQNDLCLIDGALSRKSFASPSITDAMILSTGAVLSASVEKITQKTLFLYNMTKLPEAPHELTKQLSQKHRGVFAITPEGNAVDLNIPSMLMLDKYKDKIFSVSRTLYIPGMITDKLIELLKTQNHPEEFTLITKDFTHIFSDELNTYWFLNKGGKIMCLYKTNLLAITVNPVSPQGFKIESEKILSSLRQKIPLPIYNIRNINL
ncbi:MAG: hypothetical protein J6M30_02155 [Bacteroidales bacterium]|nr:hypothetical protein [Bacteroidales bacterium]